LQRQISFIPISVAPARRVLVSGFCRCSPTAPMFARITVSCIERSTICGRPEARPDSAATAISGPVCA
jgi:hypothetical protein